MSFDIKKLTGFKKMDDDASHWNILVWVLFLFLGMFGIPVLIFDHSISQSYLIGGLTIGVLILVVGSRWFRFNIIRRLLTEKDRKNIGEVDF